MNLENRIKALVEEKLTERPDLFIVDIKIHNNSKIMVLLDGDHGIGIQDCAMVSRHVGYHLEEENLIEHAYNLEVGSPGLEVPLLLDRQYQKNIGRLMLIKLKDGKQLEGTLLSINEDAILIDQVIKEKGKKAKTQTNSIQRIELSEVKVGVSFK